MKELADLSNQKLVDTALKINNEIHTLHKPKKNKDQQIRDNIIFQM